MEQRSADLSTVGPHRSVGLACGGCSSGLIGARAGEGAAIRTRQSRWLAASAVSCTLRAVFCGDDEAFEELAGVGDADELCRRLLESPAGWGRSTRKMEAVGLLAKVRGTGRVGLSLVALLVCDCWRWRRITAELIAAIEASGLLDDQQLDELAGAFLAREHVISYSLAWMSPQWLEIELDTGRRRTVAVSEDEIAERRCRFAPPLRRWAAERALRADPARLEQLLGDAQLLEPRHRDALIRGLLDCADRLDEDVKRRLVSRRLRAGQASTRRGALDVLCELDGPQQALARARADTSASVRSWRPHGREQPEALTLLEAL